jgi:hypothetical protein
MQVTQDQIKMGADITWLLITGLKQFLLVIDLYVLNK